jgi:hypothetical protein
MTDLLWMIRWLRIYFIFPGLRASGFQISNLKFLSDFSGAHDPSPRIPLDLMVESDFGPSSFRTSGLLTFVGDETPRSKSLGVT